MSLRLQRVAVSRGVIHHARRERLCGGVVANAGCVPLYEEIRNCCSVAEISIILHDSSKAKLWV